ncbi:MAG: Bax inhibitor-1/YccA family protein [Alphaproteobacteria bacterium]|nr:Bax inhibitor-1/YccA family protein [Alphaproteobacteria bacterium]
MNSVYLRMTAGVLVTAIVALFVANSPMLLQLFLGGPQKMIVIFAPLAIVMFGFNPMTMRSSTLMAAFFGISVAYGISFATIAVVATQDTAFALDVAYAFLTATSMFAGLSIYGYTTKTDLTPIGTFSVMAIWGLFAVSLLNFFIESSMMTNMVAGIGIIVFSGLTIWQTQAVKDLYYQVADQEMVNRFSWAAALNLYISFIAIFQYVLHFMSQNR